MAIHSSKGSKIWGGAKVISMVSRPTAVVEYLIYPTILSLISFPRNLTNQNIEESATG